MNFMVRVGKYLDWPNNDFCLYKHAPVPKGKTVEYPCEKLLLGHVVSINKTGKETVSEEYKMLMLHEVQVFGFKPSKENEYLTNLDTTMCGIFALCQWEFYVIFEAISVTYSIVFQ